jgi:predicted lipoprotein with Yx(FWY)xxD motif
MMMTIQTGHARRWGVLLAGVALAAAACTSSAGSAPSAVPESAAPAAPAASAASAPSAAPAASAAPSTGTSAGGGRYGNGTAASAAPSAAPSAAATGSEVKVGNGSVGAFLTGPDGKTLYIFKKDSTDKSACAGDCAATWPPFTVKAGQKVTAGDGVMGKLTTFTRADGTKQVAYNGAPLYYFAADQAAGDTNGQGVGNVWFVAAP